MTVDRNVTYVKRQIEHLKAYLSDCVSDEDWHGCSDAAVDIREKESWIKGYVSGYERGVKDASRIGREPEAVDNEVDSQ